ncbi:hypothetical protein [Paraburkholderia oxyphila]|nr:hypothetical protein [Paraburkholderia oxyphila]
MAAESDTTPLRARAFRRARRTPDALLASLCLVTLLRALEIGGVRPGAGQ